MADSGSKKNTINSNSAQKESNLGDFQFKEGQLRQLLNEFKELYRERFNRLALAEKKGRDVTKKKIRLLQTYVGDLTKQNECLLVTIEELVKKNEVITKLITLQQAHWLHAVLQTHCMRYSQTTCVTKNDTSSEKQQNTEQQQSEHQNIEQQNTEQQNTEQQQSEQQNSAHNDSQECSKDKDDICVICLKEELVTLHEQASGQFQVIKEMEEELEIRRKEQVVEIGKLQQSLELLEEKLLVTVKDLRESRDLIIRYRNKIEVLSQQLNSNQQQLDSSVKQVTLLESQSKDYKNMEVKLHQEITEKNDKITNLENKLDDTQMEMALLKHRYLQETSQLQSDKEKLKEELDSSRRKLGDCQDQMTGYKDSNSSLRNEMATIQTLYDEASVLIKENAELVDTQQKQLEDMKELHEKSTAEADDVRRLFEQVTQELNTAQEELSLSQVYGKECEQNIRNLKEQLVSSQLQELETELRMQSLKKDLEMLIRENENSKNQIEKLACDLNLAQDELCLSKKQREEEDQNINKLKTEAETTEQKLREKDEKMRTLESEITNLTQLNSKLEDNIQSLTEQLSSAQEKLSLSDNHVAEFNNSESEKDDKIETLQKELENLKEENSEYKEKMKTVEEELKCVQSELLESHDCIDRQRENIEKLREKFISQERIMLMKEEEVEALQKILEETATVSRKCLNKNDDDNPSVKDKLIATQKQLEFYKDKMRKLHMEIQKMNYLNQVTKEEHFEEEYKYLQANLSVCQEEMKRSNAETSRKEQEIAALKSDLDTVKNTYEIHLKECETSRKILEHQYRKAKKEIRELKVKVEKSPANCEQEKELNVENVSSSSKQTNLRSLVEQIEKLKQENNNLQKELEERRAERDKFKSLQSHSNQQQILLNQLRNKLDEYEVDYRRDMRTTPATPPTTEDELSSQPFLDLECCQSFSLQQNSSSCQSVDELGVCDPYALDKSYWIHRVDELSVQLQERNEYWEDKVYELSVKHDMKSETSQK